MGELPPGQQLVTTWSIPEQYAGQTTATLRRVREQVRRSGTGVDLLTFEPLQDTEAISALLDQRQAVVPGVTVRNLFDELRRWEVQGVLHERLAVLPPAPDVPPRDTEEITEEHSRWGWRTFDEEHNPVRSHLYRADGSLLCREDPVLVGDQRLRQVQFFHPDGSASARIGGPSQLYFLWLDHVVADRSSVIVNESKTCGRFLVRYRNPRATVIHVVHSSHLEEVDRPFDGELNVWHQRLMPKLDRFDAVVFLTAWQRADVAKRYGDTPHLYAVPNASPPARHRPRWWPEPPRRPRGILVSRLAPLKQIDHAIAAVAAVYDTGPPGPGFGLAVYGHDAGAQTELEQTIRETGSGDYVRLCGYAADAAARFGEASYSLMTSAVEGQSLVLLESMAAGCVPIAYDIRYGPSELILDGETGFLVPPGDVGALTETLRAFLALPERQVRRLRAQARSRVAAFSDELIYRRWLRVQHAAVARTPRRLVLATALVSKVRVRAANAGFALAAELALTWDEGGWSVPERPGPPTVSVLLTGRADGRPWRHDLRTDPVTVAVGRGDYRIEGAFDPTSVLADDTGAGVQLEVRLGCSVRRYRLPGQEPVRQDRAELYSTRHGNLGLRRR